MHSVAISRTLPPPPQKKCTRFSSTLIEMKLKHVCRQMSTTENWFAVVILDLRSQAAQATDRIRECLGKFKIVLKCTEMQ